jgi:hypothetical protein
MIRDLSTRTQYSRIYSILIEYFKKRMYIESHDGRLEVITIR